MTTAVIPKVGDNKRCLPFPMVPMSFESGCLLSRFYDNSYSPILPHQKKPFNGVMETSSYELKPEGVIMCFNCFP